MKNEGSVLEEHARPTLVYVERDIEIGRCLACFFACKDWSGLRTLQRTNKFNVKQQGQAQTYNAYSIHIKHVLTEHKSMGSPH